MSTQILPRAGFYQLGFATFDMDAAIARMGERYGIKRFRRMRQMDWLETGHAWADDSCMIELLAISGSPPPLYSELVPTAGMVMRLHHTAQWIHTDAEWDALQVALQQSGLDVPVNQVMSSGLKVVYVDTREDLGVYTEYVQ